MLPGRPLPIPKKKVVYDQRSNTTFYPADITARQGILEKGLPFLAKPFSLPNLALKVLEVLDG